ncbi:hypothetical protein [Microbaculum marinum]|uniref:Uncharacterized protein n=1 Tax=Microbaculum marinum TaxID=1764581 RepID=A0AAW9RUP2_9HYPH
MRLGSQIAVAALTGVMAAVSVPAVAATIILENNAGPNVCEVQVAIGPYAPEGPTENFGDLQFNWRRTFTTDKLCYRISEPPDDCSGVYSKWTCCESTGGETLCAMN